MDEARGVGELHEGGQAAGRVYFGGIVRGKAGTQHKKDGTPALPPAVKQVAAGRPQERSIRLKSAVQDGFDFLQDVG
jgi:hypothetical protein